MTLNEYSDKAMVTCLASCNNEVYAINGLAAEVGEVNDKIAKWVRKGLCHVDGNRLVWNTSDETEVAKYREELIKEVGDIMWFTALLSRLLGYTYDEAAKINLAKLRDRAVRGVIVGEGDNR